VEEKNLPNATIIVDGALVSHQGKDIQILVDYAFGDKGDVAFVTRAPTGRLEIALEISAGKELLVTLRDVDGELLKRNHRYCLRLTEEYGTGQVVASAQKGLTPKNKVEHVL
jgi:hypothetical protein